MQIALLLVLAAAAAVSTSDAARDLRHLKQLIFELETQESGVSEVAALSESDACLEELPIITPTKCSLPSDKVLLKQWWPLSIGTFEEMLGVVCYNNPAVKETFKTVTTWWLETTKLVMAADSQDDSSSDSGGDSDSGGVGGRDSPGEGEADDPDRQQKNLERRGDDAEDKTEEDPLLTKLKTAYNQKDENHCTGCADISHTWKTLEDIDTFVKDATLMQLWKMALSLTEGGKTWTDYKINHQLSLVTKWCCAEAKATDEKKQAVCARFKGEHVLKFIKQRAAVREDAIQQLMAVKPVSKENTGFWNFKIGKLPQAQLDGCKKEFTRKCVTDMIVEDCVTKWGEHSYREWLLESGNTEDPLEMVKNGWITPPQKKELVEAGLGEEWVQTAQYVGYSRHNALYRYYRHKTTASVWNTKTVDRAPHLWSNFGKPYTTNQDMLRGTILTKAEVDYISANNREVKNTNDIKVKKFDLEQLKTEGWCKAEKTILDGMVSGGFLWDVNEATKGPMQPNQIQCFEDTCLKGKSVKKTVKVTGEEGKVKKDEDGQDITETKTYEFDFLAAREEGTQGRTISRIMDEIYLAENCKGWTQQTWTGMVETLGWRFEAGPSGTTQVSGFLGMFAGLDAQQMALMRAAAIGVMGPLHHHSLVEMMTGGSTLGVFGKDSALFNEFHVKDSSVYNQDNFKKWFTTGFLPDAEGGASMITEFIKAAEKALYETPPGPGNFLSDMKYEIPAPEGKDAGFYNKGCSSLPEDDDNSCTGKGFACTVTDIAPNSGSEDKALEP